MPHRVIAALLLLAAALAATTPAVESAFTAAARPGQARLAAAAQFPPRNVLPPSVAGVPRQGETLTASPATWARAVDETTGTWLRNGTEVGTGPTRVLQAADVGHRLVHRVTAANAGGSTTVDSTPTPVILGPVPQSTVRPVVTGSATVGSVLTASEGSWTGEPTEFEYRWIRCVALWCETIAEGAEAQILLTGDDAGAVLKVEVTARNGGGSARAMSAATDTVDRATFTHVLCRNPDDGAHAGADGALPPGLAFAPVSAPFPDPAPATRCASGDGIALSTGGTWSTATADAGGWLRYRGNDDVEFVGAALYREGAVSGNWGWTIETSAANGLAATPRAELCSPATLCLGRGALVPPFADANRVAVTRGEIDGFDVALLCAAPPCSADGSQAIHLLGGTIALRDTSTPQVTTAPTGGLVADPRLEGVERLAFAAADTGGGLYRVRVRIGAEEVAVAPLRAATGRCADVDPGDGDPYEFAAQRPCPRALAVDLEFDTADWPATGRLRVLLEDAGRNTTLLVDRPLAG